MDASPPLPAATLARRRPRRRLAMRLAWLTVALIVITEALFFIPSIVRLRQDWIDRRLTEAHLAALALGAAPPGAFTPATQDELLRLAGAEGIRLEQPGMPPTVLAPKEGWPEPSATIDLREETALQAVARAIAATFSGDDDLLAIRGISPMNPAIVVTDSMRESKLHASLVRYVRRIGTVTLLAAAAAGAVLYLALLYLLVRPMRQLTESIAAFRADPERSAPLDEARFGSTGDDEITEAAHELAAMQRELRGALWRNARLAALGTAMAKINHDLRGILSPAMLTAERLQMHADPSVQRAGDILVNAVERAAELARRTLEFARETPVNLARQQMPLRPIIEDAVEQSRAACPWVSIANQVPHNIVVDADRESLERVFGNLLRNAAEAEARLISVTATLEGRELSVVITDNGPGLPEAVRAGLFRPFVSGGRRGSTGLGLAIVRDLVNAHGGDVVLLDTGTHGTSFQLTLPCRVEPAAPPSAAAD